MATDEFVEVPRQGDLDERTRDHDSLLTNLERRIRCVDPRWTPARDSSNAAELPLDRRNREFGEGRVELSGLELRAGGCPASRSELEESILGRVGQQAEDFVEVGVIQRQAGIAEHAA